MFIGAFADQPRQRLDGPDLHRRLRAHGVRHGRDHGGAGRTTSGTGSSPSRSTCRSSAPCSAAAVILTVRRTWATAGDQREFLDGLHIAEAKRRIIEWLEEHGRARHQDLQAARLAVQPAAVLGRAVPHRVRRGRAPTRRAGVDAARRAARLDGLRAPRRRRARHPTRAAAGPRRALGRGEPRPRRRRQAIPPRDQHHAAVGRLLLVLPALSGSDNENRFVDPAVDRYWMHGERAAASTSTSAAPSTRCCTCSTPASGTRCSTTSAMSRRRSRSSGSSTRDTSRPQPSRDSRGLLRRGVRGRGARRGSSGSGASP